MAKGPQRIRGTQDIWGEEADRFHAVTAAFDRVRRLYGFQRIETPVFEATEVFARSIGETTDIVSKEMYTFTDKSGDQVTLRPEFTAGICRAFLSAGWQQFVPMKVAADGPVFRYERPQKGRFRQFHQLDAEILGSASPTADVELLVMADQLLRSLGLSGAVTLQLNTLGDADSRHTWRAALVDHFEAHRGDLSDDSLARLEKNPMRILDSKDPRDRPAADSAPDIDDYLSRDARAFFDEVTAGLDDAGVAWTRNARLVRGLDYYRHTAFEFVTDQLGAQGTVLAGGRYDGLMEALGGPHTPAVGWAAGIERLAMMLKPNEKRYRTAALVIESDEPVHQNLGGIMLRELRRGGMPTQIVADGNVRKRFQRAGNLEPDYLLVLLPGTTDDVVATLRVRRRISDRIRTRGAVYKALKPLLRNQFGVEPEDWRSIAVAGGEIHLRRQIK